MMISEEIQINIGRNILFASEYADGILKFFQEEFRLAEEYDLRKDLNIYILSLLVGDGFRGNISAFQISRTRIDIIYNIQILKILIYRSPEFLIE